jgi:hypothetical protein
MKWTVLGTREQEAWREALSECPRKDVYFLPEYYRVYEENNDGLGCAFVARADGETLVYPFLLREIRNVASVEHAGDWKDIETAYGYGGPLSTTKDPAFLREAWSCFDAWCQDSNVVAEFVRFHPLLRTSQSWCPRTPTEFNRTTVFVDLDRSPDDLWQSCTSVQRNTVRKAKKRGLVCKEVGASLGMEDFRRLYSATMNRLNADDDYNFSDAYFKGIACILEAYTRVFLVTSEAKPVAAALFLFEGSSMHYHLAGSDVDYRSWGANNLLLHTAALWGIDHGYRSLHLGGGSTQDSEDSLLKFKERAGSGRCEFHVGKKIHSADRYGTLCDHWRAQRTSSERPRRFLMYRI